MRLAESVRAHWFLALASVAFVGSTVAVLATCPEKEKKIIRVEKSTSPRIGKCGGGIKARKVVTPVVEAPKPDGATYRDVLFTVRGDLQRCIQKAPTSVAYRISVNVGPNGRVENVEVKAESENIADVDLHVVACVEKAVSPLQFPTSKGTNRVTARLTRD